MSNNEYDAPFIYSILSRTLFSSFCTINKDRINSRVMVFACTPDLKTFYTVTNKLTEKISELESNPYVNLLILASSNMLDDYSETQMHGKAEICSEAGSAVVKEALDLLSEKSSMIKALRDSGSLGDYVITKINAEEIDFRIYKDILQNIPKTLLKP